MAIISNRPMKKATYELIQQFREEQIKLHESFHQKIKEVLKDAMDQANNYILEHSLEKALTTFETLVQHYTSVKDETLKDILWDVVQKKYAELYTHQEKLFACLQLEDPETTCAENVAQWLFDIDEFIDVSQTNVLHCTVSKFVSIHYKYHCLVEKNTMSMQETAEDYDDVVALTEDEISQQNEVTQSRIETNHAQYEQERKYADSRIPNLQLRDEPKIVTTTSGIGKWL